MKLRIRKENTKFSFPIDVMMTKKRESTNYRTNKDLATSACTWILASCLPPQTTWASAPAPASQPTTRAPCSCPDTGTGRPAAQPSLMQAQGAQAPGFPRHVPSVSVVAEGVWPWGWPGVWGCRGYLDREGDYAMPESPADLLPGENEEPGGW